MDTPNSDPQQPQPPSSKGKSNPKRRESKPATERRRALGRGLGALIPASPSTASRPVDVFFPRSESTADAGTAVEATDGPTQQAEVQEGTGVVRQEPQGEVGDSAAVGNKEEENGHQSPTSYPIDGGQGLREVPGATLSELPIADIVPNRAQPREVFDEDELSELASSIREIGVLQPIVVRPLPGGADSDLESAPDQTPRDSGQFELIMGERRLRASKLAGQKTIPAIVRTTNDEDMLRDALLENLHRAQLNPLEEAAAYQQLLDDFGCTQEELSRRIARSRPQISNTLRLLRLPPLVQRRVAAGVLSAGHARALLSLEDPAAMERMAQRIVAEGLSVRSTEELIALGDTEPTVSRRAKIRAGGRSEALDDLAGRLSDRFDTRVKIGLGTRKGKVTIEFASVEDLNRIVAAMAPDEQGLAFPTQNA